MFTSSDGNGLEDWLGQPACGTDERLAWATSMWNGLRDWLGQPACGTAWIDSGIAIMELILLAYGFIQ